ncbi:hypothetical protein GCM10010505_39470 [Kitasatospora aburaviensis]
MTEQPGRAGPPTTAARGAGTGGFLTRIAARAAGASGAGRLRPRPLSRFEPVPHGAGAELDGFPAGAAFDLATGRVADPAGRSSGFGGAAAEGVPSVARPGRGPSPLPPAGGSADALPPGTGSPGAGPDPDRVPDRAEAPARSWWVEAPAEAWSGRAGVAEEPPPFAAPPGESAPSTGAGRPGPAPAGRSAQPADARRLADGGRDAGDPEAGPAARSGRTGGPPVVAAGGAFDGRGPAGAEGPAFPGLAESAGPADPVGRRERWAPPGRRQAPAPAPVVHVTIGRVEVRAVPASAAPAERVRPEEPAVATLDQYLRNRARSRG